MATGINRLPATFKRLKPGLHCDGGNLYLQVSLGAVGNRRLSWIFRYRLPGCKSRDMGLGSANTVTLAEAREIARENRKLVKEGIDPIARREAERSKNLAASRAVMTFDQAGEAYIRAHQHSWKNSAHAAAWPATLQTYASPVIGKMNVADIDTPHLLKVLKPIWNEKTETASRVRGRIEKVLGWATVSGYRKGDNPARWRGHLEMLLPAKGKISPVRHQKSLPYVEMPAFVTDLRKRQGMAAIALDFAIFTCVRTDDVLNAKVDDVDEAARLWTIPHFSKTGGREHRVPLSDAALAAYRRARKMAAEIGGYVGQSEYIFPNDVTGYQLSENAMLAVLERMGLKGQATVHGFRSTFRTWAQERTSFAWELCELSLGHTIPDKVARAYARGDGLGKRVAIMQAWADYVGKALPAGVTPMRSRRERAHG